MRFYKLLLIMPILMTPEMLMAKEIRHDVDSSFSGLSACIINKSKKPMDGYEKLYEGGWGAEGLNCLDRTHDAYAKKAACVKMSGKNDVAYASYAKDANGKPNIMVWKNGVKYTIPDLDNGNLSRCASKECKDGYELAKDSKGNSQGYCVQKKTSQPNAPVPQGDEQPGGVDPTPDVGPQPNNERLNGAIAELKKQLGDLDTSVWKNAKGGFNTSRLISDSVAGVVLGTTGAIITGKVIKKNQLKSGFEDIVCSVGGQDVGAYGDEITVGIR